MFPELLSIGGLKVHTYGFFMASGLLAGLALALKSAQYRNISKKFINGFFPGAIISGLVGARILYVLLKFSDYFKPEASIFRVLAFWDGGLVYFGGLIGGLGYLIYFTKKWGYDLKSVGDVLAPGVALGYSIARLGCFSAGCCYGKPTDSWLGVIFNHARSLAPQGIPLIPTQLIASVTMFLFSLGLYFYLKSKNNWKAGFNMGLFFIGYGVYRITIELFRGDFRGGTFLNFTVTQWIALLGIIAGIFLLKKPGKPKEKS